MSKMNAWLGVFVSFLMINGCFGTLAVIFCWGEILERCCTAYVQLGSESGEEDEVAEENHVELPVIPGQVITSENVGHRLHQIQANEAEDEAEDEAEKDEKNRYYDV
tara:strand:- start:3699 stop:4019 length:321 start_codon:yes stop_codon:yes gene_type:complete